MALPTATHKPTGLRIMKNQQRWIEQKLTEQQQLYEKYGRRLEPEHTGKFVAISFNGEIILGKREGEVLRRALDTFGRDNFTMVRVGADVFEERFGAAGQVPKRSNRRSAEEQEWIDDQLAEEQRLYDLYAKHLEPEHNGKFVAISFDGKVIVGKRDGEVLKRAVDMFGRGRFAMARVGHEVMHEWVTVW